MFDAFIMRLEFQPYQAFHLALEGKDKGVMHCELDRQSELAQL